MGWAAARRPSGRWQAAGARAGRTNAARGRVETATAARQGRPRPRVRAGRATVASCRWLGVGDRRAVSRAKLQRVLGAGKRIVGPAGKGIRAWPDRSELN